MGMNWGEAKREFIRRLGDSWQDLADILEIEPADRNRFEQGNQPREIWEFLEHRDRLPELADALHRIGRDDLARYLSEVTQALNRSVIPKIPTHRHADSWLEDVCLKVRQRWVDLLHRSMEQVVEIELDLAVQPGAEFDPMSTGPKEWGEPQPLPGGTELVEVYAVSARRHLVILGKQGGGKSTVLWRLAEELLDLSHTDSKAPVPVVLQLSTWDRTKGPLRWVVDQVSRWYEVPSDRVESWLQEDRLVLLLDGLDEITDLDQQRNCLKALSALRTEVPAGMVVCCRAEDYRQIGERLQFGLAVTVLPLTREKVDNYLDATGDMLAQLRHAIRVNPALAELLDTPLMLKTVTLVCQNRQSRSELFRSDSEIRLGQVWDHYTAAMLTRQRNPYTGPSSPRDQFSLQTSYRQLVGLARLMVERRTVEFYPDWFGTPWLPDRTQQWAYSTKGLLRVFCACLGWRQVGRLFGGLLGGLTAGLVMGLIYGIAGIITDLIQGQPSVVLTDTLINVLAFVLGFILIGMLSFGLDLGPGQRQTHVFVIGLVFGLAESLGALLAFGPDLRPDGGLVAGIIGGMFSVAAFGSAGTIVFTRAVGLPTAESSAVKWRWSWKIASNGFVDGLTCGLTFWLALGLAEELVLVLIYGVASGDLMLNALVHAIFRIIISTVLFGLVFGIFGALTNGWQPDRSEPIGRPRQAVQQTMHTHLRKALISALIIAAILAATLQTFPDLSAPTGALVGVIFMSVSLYKGIGPWIDHHAARLVASRAGFLPRDLEAFLDHCDKCTLLQRSGGAYLFVHHTLRDHLATCDPDNPLNVSDDNSNV
jgi:hypothetical protein